MASKYNNQNTIDQDSEKKRVDLENRVAQLYEDYLNAGSMHDREQISSQIHNLSVKILQHQKSTCAISNPSGIKEISTITLKNNMK